MIDPRGPRFTATVTSIVLAAVLVTSSLWLLAAQTAVFAIATIWGVSASPYARLYARVVRPRLGPPPGLEDERPPRFAQAVGLGFSALGLIGLLTGLAGLFYLLITAAFVAAFLNAAFGFCLGCEVYLLARRAISRPSASRPEVTTP
ncbi:MAG TPA: DUF4395 domain-containing protein [Jiangellaceae bacterium]